ncbi:hypothetical protein THAOC_24036, partial [Thalassiosira oceanica]
TLMRMALDVLRVNIPKLRHLILTYIEEQQEDIFKTSFNRSRKMGNCS